MIFQKNLFYQTLPAVIAGLAITAIAVFAWTEPSAAPPGGNVAAPLNVGNIGQSKSGGLILNTGGAATGLIVDKGNVGIGTTNPISKLSFGSAVPDVTQRIALYEREDLSGAAFRGIGMAHPSAYGVGIWALPGASDFPTNNNMALFVQDGGNVGIGTTGPLAKLHVNGGLIELNTQGANGAYSIPNSCSGSWLTNANSGIYSRDPGGGCGDEWYIAHYNRSGEASTLEIANKNDGDDHIALMPSGNVGIGTTAPSQKLDVAGYVKGQSGLCMNNDCRTTWPGGGAKQIQHYVGHRDYSGCNYTSPGAPQFYWDPALYPGLTTFLMNFAIMGTNQGWAYVTMYDVTANAPAPGTETGPYGSDQSNVFVTINPANLVTGHWYGMSAKIPSNCSAGFGGYGDGQFILRMQ